MDARRSLMLSLPCGPARLFAARATQSGEELAASIGGGLLLLLAVLLFLSVYGLFRAVCLVVRVFVRYPRTPALWITVGTGVLLCLLAGITLLIGIDPTITGVLASLAALALAALVVIAKIVEWRADALFQRERTRETLIGDVLTRPWWDAA